MNIIRVLTGCGGLALSLAFIMHPLKTLSPSEVGITAGRIDHIEINQPRKGDPDLFIWIREKEVPFRINASKLSGAAIQGIQRGQSASIGIPKEDQAKPSINRFTKRKHYNLATIDIDGRPIYSLEAYNADQVSTAKMLRWFVPGLAIVSVWALYTGVRWGR